MDNVVPIPGEALHQRQNAREVYVKGVVSDDVSVTY
jgi:hypothetical protein